MKIGILTFHRSRNYGAILQAYALTTVLKKMGYEAEIIDYACEKIDTSLKLWVKNKNFLKSIVQFIFRYQKKKSFDNFIKNYMNLSDKRNITKQEISDTINNYNVLITGSDQIWNTNITNNDYTFFLNFKDSNMKKIAYAGSVGDCIKMDFNEIECIKKYNKISVRESKLKNFLSEKKIESEVCCDPSLLLLKDDYLKLCSKRLENKKYIFLFMIWESPELRVKVNKFAKEKGYKVISNKNCFEFFLHSKPQDFLSWIKNAEYVFTNSFHGTVFSLIFHKKFMSDIERANGEKNERILEIIKLVDAKKCILENEIISDYELDYKNIDDKLKKLRDYSLEWLKESINHIK